MNLRSTARGRAVSRLLILVVIASAGMYIYLRARAMYENLGPLIVRQLEDLLGREVSIGRVDVRTPGRVYLDDVGIAREARLEQGAVLRARRVEIRYDPWHFLRSGLDPAGSVNEIIIEKPWGALERRLDGRWNVQDLFPKRKEAKPHRFRGRVRVVDGTVILVDHRAKVAPLPAVNRAEAVYGWMDFATFPQTTAGLSARIEGARGGPVRASGYVDVERARWLMTANLTNLDAAYWSTYAFTSPLFRIRSGRSDAQVAVWREGRDAPAIRYSALLTGRDLTVHTPRLAVPARAVNGTAQLDPSGISLRASGRIAGAPLRVTGRSIGFQRPTLSFQVEAPALTLAALRQAVPRIPAPKGVAAVTPAIVSARVFGPATDIVAEGTASVVAARVLSQPVRQVSVDWRYHDGVVTLTGARATGAASIQADAWVDLRTRPARLFAQGSVDGLQLADWFRSPRMRLGGEGRAEFHVVGPPDALRGEVAFTVAPLRVNNARYARASARLRLLPGYAVVHDAVLRDPAGIATAAGVVGPSGRLALTVRATSLRLGPLLKPFTQAEVQGTGYFWGQLGGTTSQPRLSGNLQVYAGRVGRYRVDFVEGPISITPEAVSTERLLARLYPASLVVRGEIRNLRAPSPTLDFGLELQDLPLGQVLITAEREQPVSGSIDAGLRLSGTPSRPVVEGFLHVAEASVRSYDLGTVSAQVRLAQDRLELTEISGGARGMTIEGSASVGLVAAEDQRPTTNDQRPRTRRPAATPGVTLAKSSPIEGTLTGRKLDLSTLNAEAAPAATLGGNLEEVTLSVSGTVGEPQANLQLRTSRMSVNGVPFRDLQLVFAWAQDRLTVRDASVRVGEGEDPGAVRVTSGSWPVAAGGDAASAPQAPGEAKLRLEQVSVLELTRLLRNSPFLGTEKGQAMLRALQKVPSSTQGLLTGDVTVAQVRVPAAEGAAATRLHPRVNVVAQVPELRIPSIGVEREPGATPAAAGAAGGEQETEPLVVAAGVEGEYESGFVTVRELEVSRGDARVDARGTILLAGGQAPGETAPDPVGRVQLQVDAVSIPMRAAATWVPALYPLGGVGDVHVDIQGPLDAVRIQASADVDNPVIAGLPFTRLLFPNMVVGGGEVRIEGARLARVVGETEHLITLEGKLPFQWGRPWIPPEGERNLRVQLSRQSLDILNDLAKIENPRSQFARVARAFGQLQNVRGDMEAEVTLAGTAQRPQNSGTFRLYDADFGIPSVESRVTDLQVELLFDGNQVAVQRFEGKSSSGGSFRVAGTINLGQPPANGATRGPLNLTVAMDGLQVRERNISRYLNERFSGTMRTVVRTRPEIPSQIEISGEFREPVIRGTVALRDASLILPAAIPKQPSEREAPIVNPRFDLVFLVERNSWIRNPSLRAEVSGQVPLAGSLSAPAVRGQLLVERGTLTFPTARFRIAGEIEINYAPGPPGIAGGPPREQTSPISVDLLATTSVTGRDPSTGRSRRYQITMTAQGPLSPATREDTGRPFGRPGALQGTRFGQLNVQATSEPPLPPSQILRLIGRQEAVEGIIAGGSNIDDVLRGEFEQALTSSVVPSLFLPFETAVEEALGLEEFGLDFAFREPLQVRLGKRLAGNFYATYIRSLTGETERYSLDLYYRISDRLKFGYRIEEPFSRRVWFLNGTFRF